MFFRYANSAKSRRAIRHLANIGLGLARLFSAGNMPIVAPLYRKPKGLNDEFSRSQLTIHVVWSTISPASTSTSRRLIAGNGNMAVIIRSMIPTIDAPKKLDLRRLPDLFLSTHFYSKRHGRCPPIYRSFAVKINDMRKKDGRKDCFEPLAARLRLRQQDRADRCLKIRRGRLRADRSAFPFRPPVVMAPGNGLLFAFPTARNGFPFFSLYSGRPCGCRSMAGCRELRGNARRLARALYLDGKFHRWEKLRAPTRKISASDYLAAARFPKPSNAARAFTGGWAEHYQDHGIRRSISISRRFRWALLWPGQSHHATIAQGRRRSARRLCAAPIVEWIELTRHVFSRRARAASLLPGFHRTGTSFVGTVISAGRC